MSKELACNYTQMDQEHIYDMPGLKPNDYERYSESTAAN